MVDGSLLSVTDLRLLRFLKITSPGAQNDHLYTTVLDAISDFDELMPLEFWQEQLTVSGVLHSYYASLCIHGALKNSLEDGWKILESIKWKNLLKEQDVSVIFFVMLEYHDSKELRERLIDFRSHATKRIQKIIDDKLASKIRKSEADLLKSSIR